MNENDAQLFGAKIGIIGEDAPSKVIQGASQLDAGKATAGDYESEHGQAHSRVGLTVSPLEHLDDVVPDANRIDQRFEIESEFLHVCHAEVIGNRAERENQVIVVQLSRAGGGGFAGPATFQGYEHAPAFKIDLRDSSADKLGAMQARTERTADVTRFETAAGDFSEHGRKE